MVEVFGFLAGLIIFINAFTSRIVELFTDFSISQLIGNRFYTQKMPESLVNKKSLDKVQSEDLVATSPTTGLPLIPMIKNIELHKVVYSLRCRCRNRTWFKDYTNSLK